MPFGVVEFSPVLYCRYVVCCDVSRRAIQPLRSVGLCPVLPLCVVPSRAVPSCIAARSSTVASRRVSLLCLVKSRAVSLCCSIGYCRVTCCRSVAQRQVAFGIAVRSSLVELRTAALWSVILSSAVVLLCEVQYGLVPLLRFVRSRSVTSYRPVMSSGVSLLCYVVSGQALSCRFAQCPAALLPFPLSGSVTVKVSTRNLPWPKDLQDPRPMTIAAANTRTMDSLDILVGL